MRGEDPGRADRDREIIEAAAMFGSVARLLLAEDDVQSTLQKIVDLAHEHLDGCEGVGVSMIHHRKITSPASSGPMAMKLDAIQQELDEGPCLDAILQHEVFRTGDLLAESRWPRFACRANTETGVSSILAIRLFVDEHTFGALNMYSTQGDAFDDVAVALAAVFATHAAIAIASADRASRLERKVLSRDLIGRAKGILMTQQHVSDDGAFALLREASQRLNLKVTDVAERVNYTGQLPENED